MSKRLQVLLEESELMEIQKIARRQGTTVAAWVRAALEAARRASPRTDPAKKLAVVRAAVRHDYPTGSVRTMLAEIERGYGKGSKE